MNIPRSILLTSLSACLLALSACKTTRGIAFHERAQAGLAVDLAAGTAPEPASLGFAWKREVFAVIPRAASGTESEAQSLISVFRAGRMGSGSTATYQVHSAFATGSAAETIAGNASATQQLTGAVVTLERFADRVTVIGACRQRLLAATAPDRKADINRAATALGWESSAPIDEEQFVQSFDLARADYTYGQLNLAFCSETGGGG